MSKVASGLAATTIAMSTFNNPALAADLNTGQKIFESNCAACHAGGQNIILAERTLQKEAIKKYLDGGFKESAIINPQMLIEKLNEGTPTLPAHVTVSGYADTSALIDITSDNTMVFNFDTTTLASHANVADFGGLVGQYRLTVKYNLLNELIVTPPFYFTLS